MSRFRMPLLAAAIVLALAGCAALPTSGAVQTGGVIDTQTQVQGIFQPSGPQPGSPPKTLVTDFIQAALDPQNDYATARKFLSGAAQQKWNPNFGVTVQVGVGTNSLDTPTHVSHAATVVGTIDATGVYTEQQPDATPSVGHGFDLAQVDVNGSKQWRIVGLDDGVIISQSTFDGVFAAYPLYFFAPGYKYLVPDVRWFATTDTITTRIANALLAGPTKWLTSPVLVTAFPPGTTLDSSGVVVDSAIATVDLSAEAKQNTTVTDQSRMQQQLSASLTSVSNVRSVALSVGGVALGTSSGSSPSTVQPSVNAATLLQQRSGSLGFVSTDGVNVIGGISTKTKALGLLGASYLDSTTVLAGRTATGLVVVKSDSDPVPIGAAKSAVDPSLDPTGFTWYVDGDRLSGLHVFLGATPSAVDTSSVGGGDNLRVVSMSVSRDGARLLLYLLNNGLAQLEVVGIVRDPNNLPKSLAPDPVMFPLPPGVQPVDAAWESDRAVAAISGSGANTSITEYEIGGPSTDLGTVPDAVQIIGGNGGSAGLRVLDKSGAVYRTNGTGTGWTKTGYTASFLVEQQPG